MATHTQPRVEQLENIGSNTIMIGGSSLNSTLDLSSDGDIGVGTGTGTAGGLQINANVVGSNEVDLTDDYPWTGQHDFGGAANKGIIIQGAGTGGTASLTIESQATVTVSDGDAFAITNGTSADSLVNKAYVDSVGAGFGPKRAVRVATTATLPNSPTYNNGTGGVGATLTAGTNAALVVDGKTAGTGTANILAGDRVLVKDQAGTGTAGTLANGIYDITTVGGTGSAWVLTRSTDFDNSPDGEIRPGDFVPIEWGNTLAGYQYYQVDFESGDSVGTDAISFTVFSNPTDLSEGSMIDISANVVDVDLSEATVDTDIGSAEHVIMTDAAGTGGNKKITAKNLFEKGAKHVTEDAIAVADDYLLFLDGGGTGDTNKEKWADVATAIAGSGISASSGVLNVGVGDGLDVGTANVELDLNANGGLSKALGTGSDELGLDFSNLNAYVAGTEAIDGANDLLAMYDASATRVEKITVTDFINENSLLTSAGTVTMDGGAGIDISGGTFYGTGTASFTIDLGEATTRGTGTAGIQTSDYIVFTDAGTGTASFEKTTAANMITQLNLLTNSGFTDTQIIVGTASGGIAGSANFTWNDATSTLALDAGSGADATITKASGAADEDLVISQTGANNSSLKLTAAGTGADAIYLQTSATSSGMLLDADGTGATSFKVDSEGTATIDGANKIHLTTAGTSANAIDIDSAGGIDINAEGVIDIQGGDDTMLNISNTQGTGTGSGVTVTGNRLVKLVANGIGAKVYIDGNGDGADAVDIDSDGGIDIDSASTIALDTSGSSANITLTTAGTSAEIELTSASEAANAIDINATAGGLDIDISDDIAMNTSNKSGNAGNITITGGNSTGANGNGGSITLTSGAENGTGTAGDITLSSNGEIKLLSDSVGGTANPGVLSVGTDGVLTTDSSFDLGDLGNVDLTTDTEERFDLITYDTTGTDWKILREEKSDTGVAGTVGTGTGKTFTYTNFGADLATTDVVESVYINGIKQYDRSKFDISAAGTLRYTPGADVPNIFHNNDGVQVMALKVS